MALSVLHHTQVAIPDDGSPVGANAWDETHDLSGTLPVANGGTGASDAATAATNLGLGIGDSPLFTAVNVGNVDTTITRASSGAIAVEGSTVAMLGTEDQVLAGGARVTAKSLSTGNITIDPGDRPLQYITNGGAFTITAPANDGSVMLLVTNNGSAGAITFSGFTVGSNVGDSLTTTDTHKFTISIWRINGTSGYSIFAHQ